MRRRFLLVVALAMAALFAAPLDVAARGRKGPRRRSNMPPGWTWPASRAMRTVGKRCKEDLTRMGVVWKRAPRRRKIATPIYVPSMVLGGIKLTSIFRKPPFVMDCNLALALAKAGEVMSQIGVRELRFSTIHEYRLIRLRGAKRRPLSRHSLGLAIDVFEIVTEDGKVVVEKGYRKKDPTLLALERGIAASLDFRTALTPRNDPRSHRDHFHLEARVDYEQAPVRTAMLAGADARR